MLNISGIFVFILFLTLDNLYTNSYQNKNILFATVLLIAGVSINYYSPIKDKLTIAKQKIKTHSIIEPNPIEKELALQGNYLTSLGMDKILVISDIDSYINYRLRYKQVGYFSPFCANIFSDQTTSFLKEQIKDGYRLIIFPGSSFKLEKEVESLNKTTSKERFIVNPLKHGLYEILLTGQ